MEKKSSIFIPKNGTSSVEFNAQSENPKTIYSELFKSIETTKTIPIEKTIKLLNYLNYYFVETQKMISSKGTKIIDFFDKECDEKDIENMENIINNKLSEMKKILKESKNNVLSHLNKKINPSKTKKINLGLNGNNNYINTIKRNTISPKPFGRYMNQNPKKEEIINKKEEILEEINPLNQRKNSKRTEEIINHFQNLMSESENEEKFSLKRSYPNKDIIKQNSKKKIIFVKKIHS
jgi:hypothetical protein